MKRVLAAGVIALSAAAVALLSGPASAQSVEVPINDVTIVDAPGTVHELGRASVDADLVGRTCDILTTIANQSSVHPGNKLIVASGNSTVEIQGIEDVADFVTQQQGSLTLGETVVVSVELGNDGATSLGSSLSVTCEPLPPAPPPKPVVKEPTYTG